MKRLVAASASLLALALVVVAVQLASGTASAPAAHGATRTAGEAAEAQRARVTIRVPGLEVRPDELPKAPPEWLFVEHEPSGSRTLPCEAKGLGPVLALRHHLAETQWASLTASSGREPILARFEIVDAQTSVSPPWVPSGMPQHYEEPWTVTAILYWADLSLGDRAAPLATYLTREVNPAGEVVGSRQVGPSVTRVRAQWAKYTLVPRSSRWQRREGRQRLAIGEAGWAITGKPRIAGEVEVHCGRDDDLLPVYDLSISRPTP